MADLAKEAAQKSGKRAKTSVGDEDTGGSKTPDGDKGKVTLEKFNAMTVFQKGALQVKNPALYKDLFKQSVKAGHFRR